MNKAKSVSVIIPTLDREEVLLNTLKDLLKQKYPNFEIVVIDQTDNPKKEISKFIENNIKLIRYLHLDKKGSSYARDFGVKNTKAEIVLFLDDDVKITQTDFIDQHLKNYQDKNIRLVGGRVVDRLNNLQDKGNEVGKFKYWGLKEITNFDSKVKMEIEHAPGGNFSCYRNDYLKVGGFGKFYQGNAHMEETDFCFRLKKLGGKFIFEPDALTYHIHYSSGGNRRNDIYKFRYWILHNSTIFYLRNFPKSMFCLFYLNKLYWAILSSLKRKDIKMFKVMTRAIKDGIKYYRSN